MAQLMLLSCGMTPAELRSRTKKFATDTFRFCETLPSNRRAQEIAAQLVDAASGVGSNYRSVCRARSPDDFINKLAITLDCADEITELTAQTRG